MTPALPFAPGKPWLAPLAGFSDLPFRLLCRELGAACAVTEMVSAKGLVYGQRARSGSRDGEATERLLATCPQDAPLVVQLFGAEADFLGRAVDILLERGCRWFDLNCGCSVPKVAGTGAGAGLLRTPHTLLAAVRAMVERAGPGRVGVKLRLGWCKDSECAHDLGPRLADLGVGWLTLHPRHARQGFSGRADWERLAAFVAACPVPVLASGDLFCAADALRCLEQTGAAGVMFARGALANPFVFQELQGLLAGRAPEAPSGPRLAWLVRRHAALIAAHGEPARDIIRLRAVLPRYVRELPGAKALRSRLTRVSTPQDVADLADEIAALQPPPAA